MKEITSNGAHTIFQNEPLNVLRRVERSKEEFCRSKGRVIAQMLVKEVQGIRPDTTADKLCCSSKEHYAAKVADGQITPFSQKGIFT